MFIVYLNKYYGLLRHVTSQIKAGVKQSLELSHLSLLVVLMT